jgi:hypothetical protein
MPSIGRPAPQEVEHSPGRGNGGNECGPDQGLRQPHAPLNFDDPPLRTPKSVELLHAPHVPGGGQAETRSPILLTQQSDDALKIRPPTLIDRGAYAVKGKSGGVQVFTVNSRAELDVES